MVIHLHAAADGLPLRKQQLEVVAPALLRARSSGERMVVWAAPAIDRAFLVVTNRGDAAAETDAVVAALINLPPP